jgi:UDP-N-acetyl-D-glucosamine/UDP-N-acetyl-D-galactosamine dehydrogenase
MQLENVKLCILGLGYVGLPLAIEFGKKRNIIGFDINSERISQLKNRIDVSGEVSELSFSESSLLTFTNNLSDLKSCNFYIVAVPTPIDENKSPDLDILGDASGFVAGLLKPGDVVVYESTVYPGATENFCVPILENKSNLLFNKDFFVGYSPERINPADKNHTIASVIKVTSGSNEETADLVDNLYKEVALSGTYKAESIKVAEAAKVIENVQRDLNIALMNELAMIFNLMNIDTEQVMQTAETKWNYIKFRPGLVGGHCIGVDPYYLTFVAKKFGFNPKIILAGRHINDNMGEYVASRFVDVLIKNKTNFKTARILILGITFKENCSDIRNSRVVDIVKQLKLVGLTVDVFDPIASHESVKKEYDIDMVNPSKDYYDGIIIAVSHKQFIKMGIKKIRSFGIREHVLYDLKYLFSKDLTDIRL